MNHLPWVAVNDYFIVSLLLLLIIVNLHLDACALDLCILYGSYPSSQHIFWTWSCFPWISLSIMALSHSWPFCTSHQSCRTTNHSFFILILSGETFMASLGFSFWGLKLLSFFFDVKYLGACTYALFNHLKTMMTISLIIKIELWSYLFLLCKTSSQSRLHLIH